MKTLLHICYWPSTVGFCYFLHVKGVCISLDKEEVRKLLESKQFKYRSRKRTTYPDGHFDIDTEYVAL